MDSHLDKFSRALGQFLDMSDLAKDKLQSRVKELEQELADRERDLAVFRNELAKANGQLDKLIGQISQELKLASLIQRALVPTEFPNIPGFEFSTKFVPSPLAGGDYFDVFEHEDKFRFGVVAASSSGYAMSALFLSILLKMSGQLEARKGNPPESILTQMARELVPNIQNQDQAHVFYGVVDRRGFEFNYCGIGQVMAFHQPAGGAKINRLPSTAGPIVKGFNTNLESHQVSLNPRDRIIICTEGVSRALNPNGEAFGEERLFKAVLTAPRTSVHDLRNEIMYQIEKFVQGRELPQDVTVIVMEVKDRVIKLAKG